MTDKISISVLSNTYNHQKRHRLAAFLITIVIIFNYFEVGHIFFVVKWLGGYLIRVWVPSLLLLYFILMQKLMSGRLGIPVRNIKGLNILLVIYIFFGYISMVANGLTLFYIMQSTLIMFIPLALYVVIIDRFRKNSDIERILKIFFVIGLVLSLYSIYVFYFIGFDALNLNPIETRVGVIDPNETATFTLQDDELMDRPTLIGLSQDRFSGIISVLVLVGLYYGITSTGLLKYFYYTSSTIMIFIIIGTMSRSGIVSLIVGIMMFLWCIRKKIQKRFMIVIVVIVMGILISNEYSIIRLISLLDSMWTFFFDSEFFRGLLLKYVHRYGGIETHVESFEYGFRFFMETPIWGHGIPNIEEMVKSIRQFSIHNRYLYILISAGVVTLIPYIGFIATLIVIARKTLLDGIKANSTINNIGFVLFPGCILFMVKLLNEGMEAYYYWIFFGLTAAWIRNSAYKVKNGNIIN